MLRLTASQLERLLPHWNAGGPRGMPAYGRLAAAVSALVLDGRVAPGTRLPAERELAARLGLSRTTVAAAYGRLEDGGWLLRRRGAGSFAALPADGGAAHWSGETGAAAAVLDLAIAAPPAPQAAVLAAAAGAVEALPPYLAGHGYEISGVPRLREALARRYAQRGLPTDPDQLLITTGAQSAISLVARTLLRPGALVACESPSYPNALDALREARARLVPLPVTTQGWDADLVRSTLHQAAPDLIYTIADFHNPTGARMPDCERAALVEGARRAGALVLVDESLEAMGLDPVPAVRPLAAFDEDERVLSVGSTKAYWGGLRVGWIRASAALVRRLALARGTTDLATPVLDQLVVATLLGREDELAPLRAAALRERREALSAALHRRLPAWRWTPPPGGLCLWVELEAPLATPLCAQALAEGVRIVPGPRFSVDGALERYLRLPFTQPPALLQDAVERIARARARLDAGGPALAPPSAVA